MRKIARRDFLKAAPMTAGALASVASVATHARGEDRQRPDASAIVTPASLDPASTALADYPIRPQPYFDVALVDGFWKSKVDTNASVTIPFEVQKLTETPRGLTGNVLEAAILSLRTHPDPRWQAVVDARVAELRREVWSGNSGFEVAATYFNVTRRTDLIEKAIAAAGQLAREFADGDPPFAGGERDAINCVQLYRATHDRTHLDLARHYLDIRGREDSVNRSRHNQSYRPVLEQSEAVGHAVNCVSLMVSLTDVGVLAGLTPYLEVAQRMWRDIVERKLYITGGVGTTGNEGFGEPYALPNLAAYAETCAALMFITLNHRLFMATGDSRYIDVMERAMYNNALSGVSAGGDRFFYVNRLASAGDGRDVRWARASLECCPPNLVRFLASMPGFIYAPGAERHGVREPVRFEPHVVHRRRQTAWRVRRQRDAVGRHDANRRQRDRAHQGHGEAARSGLGAEPAGPEPLVFIRRADRRRGGGQRQRRTRASRARRVRLCLARSRLV